MSNSRLDMRIDQDLKNRFYQKAIAKDGSGTRVLLKFIKFYADDELYMTDAQLARLNLAVMSLHSFTNNVNQAVRKLHSQGVQNDRLSGDYLDSIRPLITELINAISDATELNSEKMKFLLQKNAS